MKGLIAVKCDIVLPCFVAALAAVTTFAGEPNDWENLAVNSRNREPARTYSMPLAGEDAAFTDALEPESPYKVSLNGIWKISWAGNPDLRVKDFWRTDFSDTDWFTIDVPSCVELRGFGSPGYVNVRYPHKMEWPFIKDRQSGKSDYNPVSSYRRTFTVPEGWKGREVFLRFDGVYSAYYVWVNGQKVGYAEDSKLPSEFNITKYLNPQPSTPNLLAVEVYRWCDGSYIEDQDMTRYSGIFRDVTLWSMPPSRRRSRTTTATPRSRCPESTANGLPRSMMPRGTPSPPSQTSQAPQTSQTHAFGRRRSPTSTRSS